ncbi:hypothetical protein [Burkholderia sp. LMG 32019]|uniref:hypothetical protein n=1 Tax=Burkholderia sp. LMG 32019 TaxID=3158173 RepID=UPI003C2FC4BE
MSAAVAKSDDPRTRKRAGIFIALRKSRGSEEAKKRRSEEAKKRRSEEAKKRRSEEAKKRIGGRSASTRDARWMTCRARTTTNGNRHPCARSIRRGPSRALRPLRPLRALRPLRPLRAHRETHAS